MINIIVQSHFFLGISILLGSFFLYFQRLFQPELSEDSDVFFASIGLLGGSVVLFEGWRLDPILLFEQLLLSGSIFFFIFQNFMLRKMLYKRSILQDTFNPTKSPLKKTVKSGFFKKQFLYDSNFSELFYYFKESQK
uniref:Hypothetical chloroplast RF66 n=1 Tax=Prasinococcus sp. CCMP1194 TaxID=110672 RepID=A0A088CJ02_9VIRI|nr:hypothetical chloroplast RF66 [Prasinococcus sp. CCMP1194]